MTGKIAFALAFVAALGQASTVVSDVWDTASNNDNQSSTENEITHGFSQIHDLGVQPGPVADQDWYAIVQEPFSSYEILCDGHTGDISDGVTNNTLHRVDSTGTVLQSSELYGGPVGLPVGRARSLRFANDTPTTIFFEYVRVANAICGTNCDTEDQYRIRAWDTTIAVPRYNTNGSQLTVLIIQNPGEVAVSGNARLWTTAGGTTPVTTVAFALSARQATVINLATVNGGAANGTSGTITITHNGRYGQLAVKAVALEPSTGFSFDTPGQHKPVW
jgi:hypothetical protein